jgi:hypothetical protein
MTQPTEANPDAGWARLVRKYRAIFTIFVVVAILAVIGAVYVFLWFTDNAQSTGLVPSSLGLWSINHIVLFILHAAFWELVVIGVPVAIVAIAGWIWWKHLTDKDQYNLSGKKSKGSRAGGAISPLIFIAFAIKVYVDGNWNSAIASWTLDYVVGSMVIILMWAAAIFAIPAILGLIWWVNHERK